MTVSDNEPLEVRRARVTAIANGHAQTYRGRVGFIYETALKGYSIELPNEAAAIAISNLPQVKWVEEVALGVIDSGVTIRKTPKSVFRKNRCCFAAGTAVWTQTVRTAHSLP